MPIEVELPNGKGIAEFPDDMPEADIVRFVKRDMLVDEQASVEASAGNEQRRAFVGELGNQMTANLQQAGIGITQGMARLSQGVNKLLELSTRVQSGIRGLPTDNPLTRQFQGASEIAGQSARDLETLGHETEGSSLPRTIASGVVSSAPSIVAAPAGLAAAAATAAIQQFGNSFADFEQHFADEGASEQEARGKAFVPSLASGLITGLVTAGFGRTGIEAIRASGPQTFSQTLRTVMRQAGFEGMEEATDEVWQVVVEELAADPDKTPEEVLTRALTALGAGVVAGGAFQAATQVRTSMEPQPAMQEQTERIAPEEAAQPAPTVPEADATPATIEEPSPTAAQSAITEPSPPKAATYEPLDKEAVPPADTSLALGIVPSGVQIAMEPQPPLPALDVEVQPQPRDFSIFNNVTSPQHAFWFGRLGESAKSAWQTMALGEMEMREATSRDIDFLVDDLIGRLPTGWRDKGAQAFFELLDGKSIEEIEQQPIHDEVKQLARRVKERLEQIRTTIRDLRRTRFTTYLMGKPRDELIADYVANVAPEMDADTIRAMPDYTKQALADSLAIASYPEDWGISDGTYLPHLFAGQWKVSVVEAGEDGADTSRFLLRADTPDEAQLRLRDYVRANPEASNLKFRIESDSSIPADITRLADKQFFTLLDQMKQRLEMDADEVRDATVGLIGRKASKEKWFGSLQKRYGAANYETNFRRVMTAYLHGFHRWRVLSRVNNEVQPAIEQVRREGRPEAADELDNILAHLWGKPSRLTLEFDNFLQSIPVLRDTVKPLALDRWTRSLRSGTSTLLLTTPRFAILNRLQPLQGLYPLMGERLMLRAKRLQHSKEGKALLDRYGVTYDTGTFGEPGVKEKLARFREAVTGESSNQELAFLTLYLHGIQTGLPATEAASYAKLRGQLMTQFTPLVTDTPPLLRGPIGSTVFQFKRFPIKQLELISRMVRDRNVPGIVRLLGAYTLLGGLAFFLRSLYTGDDDKLALKRKLNEELGNDTADLVWYGLPGLANVDMSGSLLLIDQPFGETFQEKLGRVLMGPAPGLAVTLAQSAATEQREPRDLVDRTMDTLRRIPSVKPLIDLYRVARGDTDIHGSDGELRYRRVLSDVLANLGSFQSANESNMRVAVDGIMELQKERVSLLNQLFVAAMAGTDTADVEQAVDRFNQRWPEAAINADEAVTYIKRRASGVGKTDAERVAKRKMRSLLPEQPTRP